MNVMKNTEVFLIWNGYAYVCILETFELHKCLCIKFLCIDNIFMSGCE